MENSPQRICHSLPSMGGEGELQNSGNFSLSMARSSLSSLGLSKSGARCLHGMGQGSNLIPMGMLGVCHLQLPRDPLT